MFSRLFRFSSLIAIVAVTATIACSDGCDDEPEAPAAGERIPGVSYLQFGTYHLCTIDDDRKVWCTGQNHFGQLGDGTTHQQSELVEVAGLGEMAGLAVGHFDTTCAWNDDGELFCWGSNTHGVLADEDLTYSTTAVRIDGLPPVVDVDLGAFHACAVTAAGEVYCWGSNESGQIGAGEDIEEIIRAPRKVEGIDYAVRVGVGAEHSCALDQEGALYCWGSNQYGQVGLDLFGVLHVHHPDRVGEELGPVDDFDVAFQHTCATFGDSRQLHCWGRNQYGQFGLDDLDPRNKPAEVVEMIGVDEVATGEGQTCARIDNAVYCAGEVLRPVEEARETGEGYFFRKSAALEHAVELWGGILAICGPAHQHAIACRGVQAHDISGDIFED